MFWIYGAIILSLGLFCLPVVLLTHQVWWRLYTAGLIAFALVGYLVVTRAGSVT